MLPFWVILTPPLTLTFSYSYAQCRILSLNFFSQYLCFCRYMYVCTVSYCQGCLNSFLQRKTNLFICLGASLASLVGRFSTFLFYNSLFFIFKRFSGGCFLSYTCFFALQGSSVFSNSFSFYNSRYPYKVMWFCYQQVLYLTCYFLQSPLLYWVFFRISYFQN